jgi:hypothetical protein
MLIAGCIRLTQTWIEFICQNFSRFPSTKWKNQKYRQNQHFIWRSWDRASWCISIVKPSRCTILRVYWISLYVFRTVFPSIIRSSRPYIQHQLYVIQFRWKHASGYEMELQFHLACTSKQSTNLYDIYLMLYVQSWTLDDGRKDHLKHVEWYSINSKNCASSWFYHRNLHLCAYFG